MSKNNFYSHDNDQFHGKSHSPWKDDDNDNNGHDDNGDHHGIPCCNVIINVPHIFTGNAFPTDLVERHAIGAVDQAMLGEIHNNMAVHGATHIDGQITYDGAGYFNSLGAFTIAADGSLQGVQMMDKNVNTGIGSEPNVNFSYDTVACGKELGFFVIAAGGTVNSGFFGSTDLSKGTLSFIYDYGQADARTAKATDDGHLVKLVYHDNTVGSDHVLNGALYFTTDRGGSNALNSDGLVHTISGTDGADCTTLKIGFEDLPSATSDKDYNDLEFTVKMTQDVKVCGNDNHHDYFSQMIECPDPVTDSICKFVASATPACANSNIADNGVNDYHPSLASLNASQPALVSTTLLDDGSVLTHHA